MKTADEIIQTIGELNAAAMQEKYRDKPTISINEAWKMIDQARKEAIEECAGRAETVNTSRNPYETFYEIDKQSILSLIEELK